MLLAMEFHINNWVFLFLSSRSLMVDFSDYSYLAEGSVWVKVFV